MPNLQWIEHRNSRFPSVSTGFCYVLCWVSSRKIIMNWIKFVNWTCLADKFISSAYKYKTVTSLFSFPEGVLHEKGHEILIKINFRLVKKTAAEYLNVTYERI